MDLPASSPETTRDHEWQYNPRISTREVDLYHDRAATLSERERQVRPGFHADVRYGEGEDDTLDIFPAGDGAPAHLFLHGGYWRGRDKRDYSFLAGPLNGAGVTLIVANYSLCPKVRLATIIEQARRCLAALPRLAGQYGYDPQGLTASGHSAGAHLLAAALFGADRNAPPPGNLKAATLVSGIYELEPVLGITINDIIGLRPEDVAGVSPMRMQPRTDVALDIVVGGNESPGWIAQSALFAETCQKAGAPAELLVQPDENHFSIMEKYALEPHPLFQRFCRLATAR